jgi:cobalt-zinc-cadmium resistance protein CzcA
MIAAIIRTFFGKPVLALALALGGASLGALWIYELPRDVFPDLSAPIFNVIVQNAAMGAEELESSIAVPLESALAGLPAVRRIRSSSQLGVTQVTVEFEPDADYFRSRQLVAERMAQASAPFPPGTEPPLLSSLTGRLNEVFEFTLEADPGQADLMTLRDIAEFDVKRRLQAVPGVAAVEILGGHLREFQVQVDPDRMAARGVSLDDVLHALEGANENASGGFIVEGSTEWTVRAVGRASGVDDLRRTVVTRKAGTPVLLRDVADVIEAPAVRRGLAHRLRGEVVSARVTKQFGADTVKVGAGVRAAMAGLQKGLPKGVVLRVVYDQSRVVDAALGGVGRAVLIGAVLVVLVLVALLGDLRAALVVTVTIPLSIAMAGVFLRHAGVGLNTMTLGGLAIAVGLLVDAAIIVTENVLHRTTGLVDRRARSARALEAAAEVGRPIAFATLIVVAVFLPLLGMSGLEGRMYRPLAGAVVSTMAASLVLALTLVPLLASRLLRPRAAGADEDVWLLRRIKAWYAPLLDRAMRHAGAVRLLTLLITIPAVFLALLVGRDFMPRLDEGALLLQTVLPAEASLDEVDRLNHRVEDLLREFPEVEDVVRRTGRAERTEDPMPHTVSDVLVVLKESRAAGLEELEQAMRAKVEGVPGVNVLFTTPLGMRIDEGLGGTPADLVVRIFGPDLATLQGLAEQARRLIADVPGVADLRAERLAGLPQVRISPNRDACARVGLTPGDVIDAVRVALVGQEFAPIWVGERRFDLVVRLRDDRRLDVRSIRGLLIDGHDGAKVPLGQVAEIEQTTGPAAIRREAGSRRIAVEASVAGRDLGSTAAEVEARIGALELPAGYFFEVGGRVESQARAMRALLTAGVAALLAVFVLLYLALGSAEESLVILATLPDAFVGGIVALLLAGETWNVSSLVGLIGLFGIAVQNGLVLVAQTRGLVAAGRPFDQALREACLGRVRPKLLTAGTAILGLLPLLVLPLHGTEIERPLAVVMVGGLVTSTLFTLLALPTFYALVHHWREKRNGGARDRETP